jgi:hypothetical protein
VQETNSDFLQALITSDVRMLIKITKHEIIIKLIAEAVTNSQDESIKSN